MTPQRARILLDAVRSGVANIPRRDIDAALVATGDLPALGFSEPLRKFCSHPLQVVAQSLSRPTSRHHGQACFPL